MQIEKTFVVNAPAERVWQFLTDPRCVAGCLPGAAITGQTDERTYEGTITVKVGPVATSYRGSLRFEQLDAAARHAVIAASGQDVRGKGGATMKMESALREEAPGRTAVTVSSDVAVSGLLAQMGRGMIQDVSDQLFQQFTDAARTQLEGGGGGGGGGGAPAPEQPEALDVVALGAGAAGRMAGRLVRQPAFWIALVVIALLLYWLL